jgi:ribosomal protein S18 acetylase RimI-like enzyme
MADKVTPSVRDARLIDLDRLVSLWGVLAKHHAAIDPKLYGTEVHAPATYRAWLRRKLDDPEAMLLVAELNEGPIGFLLARTGQRAPIFSIREIGMIYDLVVDPSARRSGAGRALFEAAKSRFAERGLTYLQVSFSPLNESALGFWTAQGFDPLLTEAYLPID